MDEQIQLHNHFSNDIEDEIRAWAKKKLTIIKIKEVLNEKTA